MNKPPLNTTQQDELDATWINLAAAARNVTAFLLRKNETATEANREDSSAAVAPASRGQEAESD